MEFSDKIVEKVRTHEAIRADVSQLFDAANSKFSRIIEVIVKHPEFNDRFAELEKHMGVLKEKFTVSIHKAKAVQDEMHKEKPNQLLTANALDRAIILVAQQKEEAAKFDAELDELFELFKETP
jgi:hypothetical protein